MRWLVIGNNLAPSVAAAVVRHGHSAVTPAEAGMPEGGGTADVLAFAHQKQLDVLTDRDDLVEAAFQEGAPKFVRTLVYLQLSGGEVEQDDAVDRLFARYARMSTGRLYTVTETRVKVRQLPTRH